MASSTEWTWVHLLDLEKFQEIVKDNDQLVAVHGVAKNQAQFSNSIITTNTVFIAGICKIPNS